MVHLQLFEGVHLNSGTGAMPKLLKQLSEDPELVSHYASAFAAEDRLKEASYLD